MLAIRVSVVGGVAVDPVDENYLVPLAACRVIDVFHVMTSSPTWADRWYSSSNSRLAVSLAVSPNSTVPPGRRYSDPSSEC